VIGWMGFVQRNVPANFSIAGHWDLVNGRVACFASWLTGPPPLLLASCRVVFDGQAGQGLKMVSALTWGVL